MAMPTTKPTASSGALSQKAVIKRLAENLDHEFGGHA